VITYSEFATPGAFNGGTILAVGVTIEKTDLEKEADRALSRD
jgi:hypothetical protein